MKIKRQIRWLKATDFESQNPLPMLIKKVVTEETPKGSDTTLTLQHKQGGEIISFSLWGANLNKLIDKLGDDTDLWINKEFMIQGTEDVPSGRFLKVIV